MRRLSRALFTLAAAGTSFLLVATAGAQCCGDCNGDGEVTINELITAVNNALGICSAGSWDLAGIWRITETSSSSDEDCEGTVAYDMFVSQNQNSVTVTDERGRNYTGTISGNNLVANVPISYEEDSGTTTVTSLTINIQSNTSISGSSSWNWTDGFYSCSGTSSFTGGKL